ncbi:Methylamine utilization protein MauG [Neochlamydia sp. AcF65]|nr:Methylamine utilization protein MauG [Neochlamydia sp. AcF65]
MQFYGEKGEGMKLAQIAWIAFFWMGVVWSEVNVSDASKMDFLAEPQKLTLPYGLPEIPWPKDNPYHAKKAELGRLLYFDTRLSSDGTVSCASCHAPSECFSDRRPVSIGIKGRYGSRHSMTIINSAYQPLLFWDGRAKTLEEQSKGPIANPKEMTLADNPHEAHWQCQERVKNIAGYRLLFKEVFNNEECTIDDIAKALSTFERTLLSGNSPYDRYIKGDKSAMSTEQVNGYQVFLSKGCIDCHHGVNFSSGDFANIGIGMASSKPDLGRYEITKKDKDWGAFKVPILREIVSNHPYMHDGSLKTLEEVIEYYDKGGTPNPNLHPLMKPLQLKEEEKKALLSFLKALDGEGWQHIQAPSTFPQ